MFVSTGCLTADTFTSTNCKTAEGWEEERDWEIGGKACDASLLTGFEEMFVKGRSTNIETSVVVFLELWETKVFFFGGIELGWLLTLL